MWYSLPHATTVISILINCVTFLALLYPPKSRSNQLKQRLRYGICLILVVAFTIYSALVDFGVENRDLVCSMGSILVHTLLVTATLWMFLEIITGTYDIMGYERRLYGITLNQLVVALHLAPTLVLCISFVVTLVEYKDSLVIEMEGYLVRNGTQTAEDPEDNCWVAPFTYWVTWNIPAIALLLLTTALCLSIVKPYKISRIFSWDYKGEEIQWVRHTVVITLFFTGTIVSASFADAETSYGMVPHQCFFSAFFFLFSLTIFYCWAIVPPEVYFFWRRLPRNISLQCLTCGWCIIDYGEVRERAASDEMNSSLFVNENTSGVELDRVSLASSACSGTYCRHVNQKCRDGLMLTVSDIQLLDRASTNDPEILGIDRKNIKSQTLKCTLDQAEDPDVDGFDRRKARKDLAALDSDSEDMLCPEFVRERSDSKVSFSETVEVNNFAPEVSADLKVNIDVIPKSIIRSSAESTPVMSDRPENYDDTPIPSPVDTDPISKAPGLIDIDKALRQANVVIDIEDPKIRSDADSSTDAEKAVNLTEAATKVSPMEELLAGPKSAHIYTPSPTREGAGGPAFSEHLMKLMEEYEGRPGALLVNPTTAANEGTVLSADIPNVIIHSPIPGYNPGYDAGHEPAVKATEVPPGTFDVLYPLRVSSDSDGSNTPTDQKHSSDSDDFRTPPEGGTPTNPPVVAANIEPPPVASPVDFFRRVFGGRRNPGSPSPSLD